MARPSKDAAESRPRRPRPATTPEGREKQLIAAAIDLAEEQILNGTASAQVITHYLKESTTRAELEREKLRNENELRKAQVKNLAQGEDIKELYEAAIRVMTIYKGEDSEEENYDDVY